MTLSMAPPPAGDGGGWSSESQLSELQELVVGGGAGEEVYQFIVWNVVWPSQLLCQFVHSCVGV